MRQLNSYVHLLHHKHLKKLQNFEKKAKKMKYLKSTFYSRWDSNPQTRPRKGAALSVKLPELSTISLQN